MADYTIIEDGKVHTRWSEIIKCSPSGIDRVLQDRQNTDHRFESDSMAEGTMRHEAFEEEARKTGKLPKCFGLDWPVSHIEHEFTTELLPGIVVHSRPDAVCADLQTIVDYKGLALDTPIATITGWSTMKDIEVGDTIFGGDGYPCQVTVKSEVHNNPCYKITFSDGVQIIADHEHLWQIETDKGEKILNTEDLQRYLVNPVSKQRHLRISMTPLIMPNIDLPIDPYVFGAWLGDGNRNSGGITKPLESLFEEIKRRGYEVKKVTDPNHEPRTVYGIKVILRTMGVLANKRIPDLYLRSSYKQRLDLLRGIMDTDGHWNKKRKRCVVVTSDGSLAENYEELICSLGWSAHVFKVKTKGFGKVGEAYQVWFTPYDEEVFLARRPSEYRIKGSTECRRRLIYKVEKIDTVPTQCIQVNSPDETFLCGRHMVRTHNTVLDGINGYKSNVEGYRHASKQRQLIFYAYQLGLHGIRIRKGLFALEIWSKERDTILGYEVVEFPIIFKDMAEVLTWAKPRIALLASVLEEIAV